MKNSLCIPTSYNVDLPKSNELYYNENHKYKIRKPLLDASKGYCMYCGKRMIIETDLGAQLEHSVDKKGNLGQETGDKRWKYLRHCKHNFALSCPTCNMVCKKHVEKINLAQYPEEIECKTIDCNEQFCDTYNSLRNDYIKRNAIILQPVRIQNDYVKYGIMYDLIKHTYSPNIVSVKDDKDDEDDFLYECNKGIFYIQNHIDRFKLNGERFSECVIDICAEIVFLCENGFSDISIIWEYYADRMVDNIVGEIFIEYLKGVFTDLQKLIEYCKLLVLFNAVC